MVRPAPQVILKKPQDSRVLEVFKAVAIYAVFYQDHPINVCLLEHIDVVVKKYSRIAFANPGHAHNLARKLNKMFETTDFHVYELSEGKRL